MEDVALGSAANDPGFWRGKTVLLTGHTGFKGGWLALWLQSRGAKVCGISLPPVTTPNLFTVAGIERSVSSQVCDIRDAAALTRVVRSIESDVVIHLAAQPLVRASYRHPGETFSTNVQGTVNLLDALRDVPSVRVILIVTTDKVYRSTAEPYPHRETDPLGGVDPYSASKAACEIVVASYREAFFAARNVALASARAGNVIGGGDWSEDRLIPDAVRAWSADQLLHVRKPNAVRPWQHVLEPLTGYLQLVEAIWREPHLAGPYNFGPATHHAASVRDVVDLARQAYGKGEVEWGGDDDGMHESAWLALEVARARAVLGFETRWSLEESVKRTMEWYKKLLAGRDARSLCMEDMNAYDRCGGREGG